jgi:hypothetical protein
MPRARRSGTIAPVLDEDPPEVVDEDDEQGLEVFDPYRLAAVDSPTSREAIELLDLTGVPLN